MLSVIAFMLFVLIIVLILVLFTAYDIIFEVYGFGPSSDKHIKVRWLWFSICVLKSGKGPFPGKVPDDPSKLTEKALYGKHVKKFNVSKYREKAENISFHGMFRTYSQLRSPLFRFLKGFLRSFRVPYAKVSLIFGFQDPADTGIACGYAYALKGYLKQHHKNLLVEVEPDFVDEVLDFGMIGTLRIRPYRFIFPLVRFVMDREVLRFSFDNLVCHCKKSFRRLVPTTPCANL